MKANASLRNDDKIKDLIFSANDPASENHKMK